MQYNSPLQVSKRFSFFLLFFSFLLTLPAHAQFRASIQGVVADPTGAVIPGATVTLTDTTTNHTMTTTSSGAGVYTFNALPPNQFTLTVRAAGFKKKTLKNVQITPEQANAINVTLNLGKAAQTVTVNGSQVNLLNTETATLSGTVTSREIQHLPSFNRDVFQLAQLAPGVFGDASQGSAGGANNLPGSAGPGGPAASAAGIFQTENQVQIQAIGGQNDTNGISVDGISTVSAVWGGASVITPSEDSVQSVTIVSNSYDAENGRFSGAQMQVITKSGSNHLHGSAFFKASRPGLNAYQRFNGYHPGIGPTSTAADKGVNRDEDRTNNYGGSLGGPIWKNKIFAFFNYETSPLTGSITAQQWFETPQFDSTAATAGSIAAKYLSFPGETPATTALIAETCDQIGLTQGVNCNQLPGGLDVGSPLTTGLGHQDLTYGGNNSAPGVGGGLDGVPDMGLYNVVNPTTISQAQYNGRLDVLPDQKDRVTFAIYWVPLDSTDYNGPNRTANLWHHSQINDAFSVIWNHVFSPTLLNQARANAAGYRWNELTSNPQAPFGLPPDRINGYNLGSAGFEYFGPPSPSVLNQWTYDYNDVLTKTLGRQNIKVGGELTRLYYLNENIGGAQPNFNFENLWDFANDATYQETGNFDSATGVPYANRQDDRINLYAGFVQDDYKVRPNLTLNLGLRWSYFGGMYAKQNNLDVLQFGSGANLLTGMHVRVGGHLYTPQKSNWGPQVGFAWQPKELIGKDVLRGGFGINYNQNEIAIISSGFGNPPNVFGGNFQCAYPFTTNPTCAGNGILYQTASSVNSIFGYPANPAAISSFGPDNFPTNYGGGIPVIGFPSNPKTITTYHYSLQNEYQLPFESVFTLGYQGSQTRHLLTQMNLNAVAIAEGIPVNPKANRVGYFPNTANSNYNALIATLRHSFSHGFNAQAQYTWAKTMDENSSPYEEDPYPYDVHAAYGRADYNVQNAFKLFGLWQPVFFHGNNLLEKTLGGWALGGIWNLHTGFPFNPVYNTTGVYYQNSDYSALRPAAVRGGAGSKTGNSIFRGPTNLNYGGNATTYFVPPTYVQGPAFPASAPAPAPGIHRNSLNGPGYNDVDASLSKSFGLPDNRVLGNNAVFEVRADAYNVFNKVNLNGGSIDNLVGSANPDGTVASFNSHFGVANTALGGRTVQLQARFSF